MQAVAVSEQRKAPGWLACPHEEVCIVPGEEACNWLPTSRLGSYYLRHGPEPDCCRPDGEGQQIRVSEPNQVMI